MGNRIRTRRGKKNLGGGGRPATPPQAGRSRRGAIRANANAPYPPAKGFPAASAGIGSAPTFIHSAYKC